MLLQAAGEPYKLEILDSILERDPQAPITIYHIGAAGPVCPLQAGICCRPALLAHAHATTLALAQAIRAVRSTGGTCVPAPTLPPLETLPLMRSTWSRLQVCC